MKTKNKRAAAGTAAERNYSMNIISQKRYANLRREFKKRGLAFNKPLVKITGRSPGYVSYVINGRHGFTAEEMDAILCALGEPCTFENFNKFFPALGLGNSRSELEAAVCDVLVKLISEYKEAEKC